LLNNLNVNNSLKIKQQRNNGTNRYHPSGYIQTKHSNQTQWNNSILSQSIYANLTDPYQQSYFYGEYYPQQNYSEQFISQESSPRAFVIYIYGIGQKPTEEQLLTLFQPYGNVVRVDIIIDFNTGLCKGYFIPYIFLIK